LEGAPPPYSQRGHQGNISFTPQGHTSSQVFVDWIGSAPDARGYLLPSSDIVSLLAFDHQMPAINLMTKLTFLARRAAGDGHAPADDPEVRRLAEEVADYRLFANEAALPVSLKPRAGFAAALASRMPADGRGRSLAELDLQTRLLRYPCSYMVYSEAFEDLPSPVRQLVYQRMIDALSRARRDAVLEILRATKAGFPFGPTEPLSGEEPGKARSLDLVARKDRVRVRHAEVPYDDLGEHVAEVGRDREIAPVVALFDGESRPPAVDAPAADA